MARRSSEFPTELELQILKVLWGRGPLPVRDVRQGLAAAGRDLAHTSVITTLNVMVQKKYLKRRMQGKACVFTPRVTREEVSRTMLGDVVGASLMAQPRRSCSASLIAPTWMQTT